MPAFILARLYRALPLIIILAIIAVAIYLFVSWRHTPNRAKEVLIKSFIVLNGALSAFFLLATLYAWIENNAFVADFFITCLVLTLITLGITFICRWRFLKNHPNYRWRLTRNKDKGPEENEAKSA